MYPLQHDQPVGCTHRTDLHRKGAQLHRRQVWWLRCGYLQCRKRCCGSPSTPSPHRPWRGFFRSCLRWRAAARAKPTSSAIESLWFQAPRRGFLGGWAKTETLKAGTVIDRYGAETGRFLSPGGTPFEARSLPTGSGPLRAYEVAKPLEVQAGITAPAFGQSGLGIQYMTSKSVADLIRAGYLKPVG
jgi:hypothetical protein